MDVGQYIKQLRISAHYTQEELGALLGVNRAAVQKWESGKVQNLKRDTIKRLSEIFSVSPASFIDTDITTVLPLDARPVTVKSIPLFAEISCGQPIYADEDVKCYVPVGDDIEADFCVIAKGDSMTSARINDGDVVFIQKADTAADGEIVAVWIDGDGATLKRIYTQDNTLTLVAENPKYPPMVFSEERCHEVRLLGKAVAFQSGIV